LQPVDGNGQAVRPPSYNSANEPSVKYSAVAQQDVDSRPPPPAYSSERGTAK